MKEGWFGYVPTWPVPVEKPGGSGAHKPGGGGSEHCKPEGDNGLGG